jgi:hypothetical protein
MKTLPGFNAEVTLRKTSTCYGSTSINNGGRLGNPTFWAGPLPNTDAVIPQFSFHSFVCAALVAGILAGQEELIPVLLNAGCYGDA